MLESLPTPDALREFLVERHRTTITTSDARPGTALVGMAVSGAAREEADDRSRDKTRREKPRIILRGLAPDFVRVLLGMPSIGIDAGFIDAHAARRRYQPHYRRLGSAAPPPPVAAAQWNYPELVGGLAQAMWRMGEGAELPIGDDLLGRAAVRAVSDCEDLAAAECRASVWVGEEVEVLFLDQPLWEDPRGMFRKARRRNATAAAAARRFDESEKMKGTGASPAEESEEIPGLEDALQEKMSSSADATGSKLVDILEEAAYNKWLDFFEVLTPRQSPLIADGSSLEWRALQALEQNLDMAKRLTCVRRHGPMDSPPDWPSLLQCLRDRTALLATIPQSPSPRSHIPQEKRSKKFHADNFTNLPVPRRRRARSRPPPPAKSGSEENQRALDRVTYLGGILLPISIVSSVLSMNEDFEPGHSLFWVFWAAAVPLTLLTFAVIYADKLRSAEVWEEIGSLGAGSSLVNHVVEEEEEAEQVGKKKGKKKTKTYGEEEGGDPEHEKWGRLSVDDRSRRHRQSNPRPQAMAYAGQDVVIDLSEAVAQPQPITLEPRTSSHRPDEESNRRSSVFLSVQHQRVSADEDGHDDDDDDDDLDSDMYITRPENGDQPHAWRKKQLGWGGAAMCILRMQKPLRVEDGLPVAPGPRRDVERRLREVKRKASAEGRRSLSY